MLDKKEGKVFAEHTRNWLTHRNEKFKPRFYFHNHPLRFFFNVKPLIKRNNEKINQLVVIAKWVKKLFHKQVLPIITHASGERHTMSFHNLSNWFSRVSKQKAIHQQIRSIHRKNNWQPTKTVSLSFFIETDPTMSVIYLFSSCPVLLGNLNHLEFGFVIKATTAEKIAQPMMTKSACDLSLYQPTIDSSRIDCRPETSKSNSVRVLHKNGKLELEREEGILDRSVQSPNLRSNVNEENIKRLPKTRGNFELWMHGTQCCVQISKKKMKQTMTT